MTNLMHGAVDLQHVFTAPRDTHDRHFPMSGEWLLPAIVAVDYALDGARLATTECIVGNEKCPVIAGVINIVPVPVTVRPDSIDIPLAVRMRPGVTPVWVELEIIPLVIIAGIIAFIAVRGGQQHILIVIFEICTILIIKAVDNGCRAVKPDRNASYIYVEEQLPDSPVVRRVCSCWLHFVIRPMSGERTPGSFRGPARKRSQGAAGAARRLLREFFGLPADCSPLSRPQLC